MFVKFVDFNLPSGSTLRASFITIDFEYAVALLLLLPIGLLNWLISSFQLCCKFPPYELEPTHIIVSWFPVMPSIQVIGSDKFFNFGCFIWVM